MYVILVLLLMMFLPGCQSPDGGFAIDLSSLNWQVIALIVLAYLANSRGHLASIATALKKTLQTLKVLPPEQSSADISAQELARMLAELQLRLRSRPDIQAELLQIQAKCLEADRVEHATAE